MTPPVRPNSIQRLPAPLGLAVACAWLLTSCATAPASQPAEGVVNLHTTATLINEGGPVFGKPVTGSDANGNGVIGAGGNLINEGGPVFGRPNGPGQFQIDGLVSSPRYFTGALTALSVTAERLNGVSYPDVAASRVQADGSFTLKGPATDKFFFASASFNFEDTSHTVRALAKAGETSRLVIDTASTLVAAKVAVAEQKRHLFTIDYQETQDLTGLVRTRLGSQLDAVRLDAANAELSMALNVLAAKDASLKQRLVGWEFALDPTLGRTPDPLGAATSKPAATPSPTPTSVPPSGAPPVK